MPRSPLSFVVPDASLFAKALGQSLQTRHAAGQPPPGHVELLNLLARALGHRNLQSLQAATLVQSLPPPVLAAEDRPPPDKLSDNARKALGQFDSRGRLVRWPVKYSVQALAMWVLWTLFDGRRVYTEAEVNQVLKAANAFWRPCHAAARTHQPPADDTQERLFGIPQAARPARRRGPRACCRPGGCSAAPPRVCGWSGTTARASAPRGRRQPLRPARPEPQTLRKCCR